MNKGIVIAGPTGVGKTDISIKLAKLLNAEIISADSAQVYKGLNIGTAKIPNEEKQGIMHHMLDLVEPISKYSVGLYEKKVNSILNSSSKNFLLVGGTGLYINSITDGLSILPNADRKIRDELSLMTNEELFERLKQVDKEASESIHINNRVRLERALEVYILTGEKFSILSKRNIKSNSYSFIKIALERNRDHLYERINRRVDIMLEHGLIEEVSNLYKIYGDKLLKINIIGYTELIKYFKKEFSLDEAIYEIKKNSRHYAKRQFTWFKMDKSYIWFNLDEISEETVINNIYRLFQNHY